MLTVILVLVAFAAGVYFSDWTKAQIAKVF